jgi:hypothetical protein
VLLEFFTTPINRRMYWPNAAKNYCCMSFLIYYQLALDLSNVPHIMPFPTILKNVLTHKASPKSISDNGDLTFFVNIAK